MLFVDVDDPVLVSKKNRGWTADMDKELIRLVKIHRSSRCVDWVAVSEQIGRTAEACKMHLYIMQRERSSQPDDDLVARVSNEVKQQYEAGLNIDWSAVAASAGVSELECMESNKYDVGKQQWAYHYQTFSWDLANRMRDFISKYYPKPLLPNFTAVSNYLWIVKDDCINMHRLAFGTFKWTDEVLNKVVDLRSKGLSYSDIALRLSPTMSADRVTK
ncbi:hypothetical protein EC988_004399, partial [Linderina pennispora]